jgi:hypothetical protein
MALSNHDQEQVRDYLLGHLSDEEQQKVEERLMTEDEFFEELEISKGELIEEYCADELPQEERNWFRDHYLRSAEGRQRHAFVIALDSVKRSHPAPRPLTWFERLKALFRARPGTVAFATATALVLIVAVLIISPTQTVPTSYAFSLNSTLSRRSAGDARYYRVPLNPDVNELRITLQLQEGVPRGTDYRVELDDRTQKTSLKPLSHDANSVLVVLPTASLHESLYALRLSALQADGTEQPIPGEYLFELDQPQKGTKSTKD